MPKSDMVILGVVGAGAALAFLNRDAIGEWFNKNFNPMKTIADAGASAGTDAANFIDKTTTIITKKIPYDFAANFTNFMRTLPGQECFGGSHAPGCPDAPVVLPTEVFVNGQGFSGTPEFLTQKIVSSKASEPYNPSLKVIPIVAVSSPAPTSTATLTPAQQYAKTFAMPGSAAWIAAGL